MVGTVLKALPAATHASISFSIFSKRVNSFEAPFCTASNSLRIAVRIFCEALECRVSTVESLHNTTAPKVRPLPQVRHGGHPRADRTCSAKCRGNRWHSLPGIVGQGRCGYGSRRAGRCCCRSHRRVVVAADAETPKKGSTRRQREAQGDVAQNMEEAAPISMSWWVNA